MIENTQNSFEMHIGFFIFYIIFINYIIFMSQILSFWLIGSKTRLCRGRIWMEKLLVRNLGHRL